MNLWKWFSQKDNININKVDHFKVKLRLPLVYHVGFPITGNGEDGEDDDHEDNGDDVGEDDSEDDGEDDSEDDDDNDSECSKMHFKPFKAKCCHDEGNADDVGEDNS